LTESFPIVPPTSVAVVRTSGALKRPAIVAFASTRPVTGS
jgi:hypothetical protein